MPLPKAIEEQARKAEELMGKGTTGEQKPTAPTPAPANEGQPAQQSPQQTPAPEPAPAPTAAPPPQPAMPDAEPKDFEQRYRVLQGKYNAEVPRLQRENRTLSEELTGLRGQIGDLTKQLAELKAAPAPARANPEIKPEEIEQYGEDFVDFVKRVARGEAPKGEFDMSAVENRLRPVEEVAMRSAKSAFFHDLSSSAPKWEVLNTDAGFLGWLAEHDPLTGVQRQVLFDDAYGKLDVHRVAAFFNAYSGQSVGAAPNGLPSMDEQVVPRSGGHTPPPNPQERRIWKRGEIQDFYNRVRRREVSTEEAARIEQDINAAIRENRVR